MMTQSVMVALLLGILLSGPGRDPVVPPGTGAADTSLASLYAAREKAWRDFFGNPDGLAEVLPENFTGIVGDSTWSDRATTLAESRASVQRGTRLVSLRFPRNRVERYGDVAVIHSRYEAVLDGGGRSSTIRGNITEVFVWTGRSWSHPSWHMDYDPEPESGKQK